MPLVQRRPLSVSADTAMMLYDRAINSLDRNQNKAS